MSLTDEEYAKIFYGPFCSNDEIRRLISVQNGYDYLLKLRADTVADHMRLFRVYRNKARATPQGWTFEGSFDDQHFKKFISLMPPQDRKLAKLLTFGNIFSTNPNGEIFLTQYGPVITICDSLRYFIRFMNLGILNFDREIPMKIRVNSLRIALRVMLKTEALDFYMDPRGIIPPQVETQMNMTIKDQLVFIAGHEFGHFIKGHLNQGDPVKRAVLEMYNGGEEKKYENVFNSSHKMEFESDEYSANILFKNRNSQDRYLKNIILWFCYLELYETFINLIYPPVNHSLSTHPSGIKRAENILSIYGEVKAKQIVGWDGMLSTLNEMKKFIVSDVNSNLTDLEVYGSFYLDEPNTEWRGRELIDRKDFY